MRARFAYTLARHFPSPFAHQHEGEAVEIQSSGQSAAAFLVRVWRDKLSELGPDGAKTEMSHD